MSGLIVDLFAGGGGASVGIEMALGRNVDIAINHDPDAILMHKTNHPATLHFQEDIFSVNPKKVTAGRKVDLLWASPDCKHFSKAKGGKPKDKNIRALPWAIVMWARQVKPSVIIAENVEEIQTWGPLDDEGIPIPAKKGETFQKFIAELKGLGYIVEWRELIAADYGTPTTRKRWYMIARCDGKKIKWPERTHAKKDSIQAQSGLMEPWVPVSTVLDFTDLGKSIFGRKKPLAENTMKRIARGLEKFVFNNKEPFIVCVNHGGNNFRGQEIHEPLQTITAKHGYGVVTPYMVQLGQTGFTKARNRGIDEPLSTIVSKNEHCLLTPWLIQYHSETGNGGARGQRLNDPINMVDTSNRYGLASAFLTKFYKTGTGQMVTEPLHTITTSAGHFGEVKVLMVDRQAVRNEFVEKCNMVASFIMEYYGCGTGQSLNEPLHTVVTKDRFALVTVYGIDYVIVDITLRMLTPRELFAAQGFPADYIIDRDHRWRMYPVAKQVARCGNSVVPLMAKKIVEENCPYLKVGERRPSFRIESESNGQIRFVV